MTKHPTASRRRVVRGLAPAIILIAAGVIAYGLVTDAARVWPNLLLDGFYVMSLGVSGLFFLASQRLTGARWSAGLRRVPEALMLILPVAAILILALYFGRHTLYSWSRPEAFLHESPIAGRAQYLQVPLVFGRAAATLVLWMLFAFAFRRTSLAQDRHPADSLRHHQRLTRLSALFTVLFAPTFTLATYDWIMSLDPTWFSTMFAVNVFAGTFVQGIAAVTLAVVVLHQRGVLKTPIDDQLHDLGKMLLAFTTFWAYTWVCQYLLIWYGNIPEEVTHYAKRTNGPWVIPFAASFLLNWAIPFVTLLSFKTKRDPAILKVVCLLLLAGHWLDLYVLIMPASWERPVFGVYEVAIAAGYLALVTLVFARNLARAPLVPVNDPVLAAEMFQHAHGHS